jgi:hypothetical protein
MCRPLTVLVALVALLGGCAARPPVDSAGSSSADPEKGKGWAKIDSSYAAYGDFERAQAACGIKNGMPDVAAAPGPRKAYQACMRSQGWALVPIE